MHCVVLSLGPARLLFKTLTLCGLVRGRRCCVTPLSRPWGCCRYARLANPSCTMPTGI
ncbi:hypothetical protein PF003_g27836 [Phytophthora fragariae]|nr:hypothetical protein PF003_g27836 [Phytophthora fragariae]